MSSHPASASGAASQVMGGPAAAVMQNQQQTQSTGEAGFADQVKGYAKEFAGKTFGKEHEQAQGQAVRKGEMSPEEAKNQISKQ